MAYFRPPSGNSISRFLKIKKFDSFLPTFSRIWYKYFFVDTFLKTIMYVIFSNKTKIFKRLKLFSLFCRDLRGYIVLKCTEPFFPVRGSISKKLPNFHVNVMSFPGFHRVRDPDVKRRSEQNGKVR